MPARRKQPARPRARPAKASASAPGYTQPTLPFATLPSTLLSATPDTTSIEWLARILVPAFGDWVAIHSVTDDGSIQLEAAAHAQAERTALLRDAQRRFPSHISDERGIGRVIRTGQPHVYPDISAETISALIDDAEHAALLRELAPMSGLIVPLVAGGKTIGSIALFSSTPSRRYGEKDLDTALLLAREAAVALENVRLFRQAQDAERRIRELVEGLDAILWEADATTLRFTFVSQGAQRLLGYAPEEWLADPGFWNRLVHPDDRERVFRACREAIGQRRDHDQTFRVIGSTGQQRWARNIVRVVLGENGRPARLRGLMVDITERRNSANALRDSEERFRKVFETGPVGMALVGIENRLLKTNDALSAMLGFERTELNGRAFVDFTHPADLERLLSLQEELLSGEIREFRTEIRFVAKRGELIWADLSASIVRDRDGEPLYGLGIVQNITDRKRAMEALGEAQERLQTVVSNAPVILFAVDATGTFTFIEGKGLEAIGVGPLEIVGRTATELDREFPGLERNIRRALEGEEVNEVVHLREVSFDAWLSPIQDAAGRVVGAIGVGNDVTARVLAERALRASEERYRELFENANDIVYTHDLEGNFTSVNRVVEQATGYTRDEILGMNIAQVLSPEHLNVARTAIARKVTEGGRTTYELEIVGKDRRRIPLEVSTRLVYEGAVPVGVQGIARDVTERRAQTAALEYQALHDSLTDLPNRALLVDRLRHGIRAGRRAGEPVVLLLMDLDHFKDINDTLGHHKGDLVLQQIGPRIAAALRASDTVARLGGDEFAVLLPGTDVEGAQHAATKILQALERPVVVEDLALDVRASIGIAIFPQDGDDENLLIQRADVAMYVAKQSRAGYAVYEAEHDRHSPRRLTLVAELRQAIEADRLVLHYQPTIDLRTGELMGLEALVRWPHPEHGLLAPDEFIPLAEHTGLIRPLTLRVLHAALLQCRQWRRAGLAQRVAVNLSARSLHDQRLPETVAGVLADYQLDPDALTLEITESAIMEDPPRALDLLSEISAMGTRLTIDDFGTGYSSLMHLKRLPVDEIKIDKSFVLNIHRDDSDAVISRSTIDLGHNLGLKVVAEGVESREALSVLIALGCDIAQGNLVAPPMPGEDVPRWLRETRWGKEKVIDLTRGDEPAPAPRRAPVRPRRIPR